MISESRPVIGLGYRSSLGDWIQSEPAEVQCLEITAEHFFDGHDGLLRSLRRKFPVFIHGLGLSLGTPGPLDPETLEQFERVVGLADPEWISEHVAFTRSSEVDLGHLNPVAATVESLSVFTDHVRELIDLCEKPLILENITSFLEVPGEMPETEFLNRLCEQSGCGILLDVTNLFINSRNHRFDPLEWLNQLEPSNIVQLHVVGYSVSDGVWYDRHADAIQDELFDLVGEVLRRAPVQAIIIERDTEFPSTSLLADELRRLSEIASKTELVVLDGGSDVLRDSSVAEESAT